MSSNSYRESIDWLFTQFPSYQTMGSPAYKPGLDGILKLCSFFGNPHEKLRFVHVAGSNGKGSTSSMLASFLTENTYNTGLFTSPHLVDFRERIRIDGKKISEGEVINFTAAVRELNLDFEPSFFEISFTMALVHFLNCGCEICVIETGLGGRLDATNIIHPLLSIITTISLEHTNFLGNTLPAIASEKAGIIKREVPVLIGKTNILTDDVFKAKAKLENSEIYFVSDKNVTIPEGFPLLGEYQKENFKTVYFASEILSDHLKLNMELWPKALEHLTDNTGFQGRLQVVSNNPRVIFDVSHNAEGIEATLSFLLQDINQNALHIVYGSSSDKNFEEIFALFPINAHYYFTEFENNRSASKEVLMQHAQNYNLNFKAYQIATEALNVAKKSAKNEDTILVFGSFFLLHDFLK